MKFKAGESVVCINDDFRWAKRRYAAFNITWPVRGKCYVVRKYVIGGPKPALVLQGIRNPRVPYMDGRIREAGYWDARFERAPSIDGLKQVMDEVARWLPGGVEEEKILEDVE